MSFGTGLRLSSLKYVPVHIFMMSVPLHIFKLANQFRLPARVLLALAILPSGALDFTLGALLSLVCEHCVGVPNCSHCGHL